MTATPSKVATRAGIGVLPAALCRRVLAALNVGLVLLQDGQVTWTNTAAVQLLGADDRATEPWHATLASAREFGAMAPRVSGRMHRLGTIRGLAGQLRVCGVRLPRVRGTGRAVLLIVLEPKRRSGYADGAAAPDSREKRPVEARLRSRFQLTAQECQVARLLADGCSNARVAATLGISPNTARIHTERVLRKLGVHSRAAVAAALRRST